MRKVEIKSTGRILNDFFKVEEAHLRYEKFNGEMSDTVRRLNFERGDAVAILVYNKDKKNIILTNQFRYPAHTKGDGWLLEVVAGIIDDDDSPKETAYKELREEIGYKTGKLTKINEFYVSPGGSSERIYLYFAAVEEEDRIEEGGGLEEEGENIQVVELSLSTAWEMLEEGKIKDAKTIIALMWLQKRVEERD